MIILGYGKVSRDEQKYFVTLCVWSSLVYFLCIEVTISFLGYDIIMSLLIFMKNWFKIFGSPEIFWSVRGVSEFRCCTFSSHRAERQQQKIACLCVFLYIERKTFYFFSFRFGCRLAIAWLINAKRHKNFCAHKKRRQWKFFPFPSILDLSRRVTTLQFKWFDSS